MHATDQTEKHWDILLTNVTDQNVDYLLQDATWLIENMRTPSVSVFPYTVMATVFNKQSSIGHINLSCLQLRDWNEMTWSLELRVRSKGKGEGEREKENALQMFSN